MRSSGGQLAPLHGQSEQDLDVDLVVGRVDAGRVVDEVGVDAPALDGVFDPPALGEPQVPSLAHHAGADLVAVDPHRVVRAVTDLRMPFIGGFHVGADPAVPEQVDGSLERSVDHLVGRHLGGSVVIDAQRGPCLR